MKATGKLRSGRKGQATVIGIALFLVLLLASVAIIYNSFYRLDDYNLAVHESFEADIARVQEDLDITAAYLNENGNLVLNMTNRGTGMAHPIRLWIINQTDNIHYSYDFDDLYLAPGESVSNVTQVTLTSGKDYAIRVVTENGNIVSFNLVPQIRARLHLIVESSTVKRINFTVTLAVTNNDTSNNYIYNLQPTLTVTPTGGAEYMSGPEPATVQMLAPKSTALFRWVYQSTGETYYLDLNSSFVNAPQGNYVTSTMFVRTFLEVSVLGNTTLTAATTPGNPFVAFGSNNKYGYLLTGDGSEAWSYLTGKEVKATAMTRDGDYIVHGSDDKKIYYFTNSSGTPQWSFTSTDKINDVAISWDGEEVVAVNEKKDAGSVDYFNASTTRSGAQSAAWSYTDAKKMLTVAIQGGGTYVAAGQQEFPDNMYFFNASSATPATPVWTYNARDTIFDIAFADNVTLLVIGDEDDDVYCFNFSSATPATPVWTYSDGNKIRAVDISDDGSYVVAGGDAKIVSLLNSTGGLIWSYTAGGRINSLSMTPEGTYIAAGSDDKSVYLFKLSSGYPLWQFEGSGKIVSVDVASDGSFVVAGDDSGRVYLIANDPGSAMFGAMQPLWTYTAGDNVYVVAASGTLFPTSTLDQAGAGTIVLGSSSRLVYTDLYNNTYTGALISVMDAYGTVFRVGPGLDSQPIHSGDVVTLTFAVPHNELETAPTGETLYTYLALRGIDQEGYSFIQRIVSGVIGRPAPP